MITPGSGATLAAFNQTTSICPKSNARSGPSTPLVHVPWAAPKCQELQKPRATSAGLNPGARGGSHLLRSLLGVASLPPPSLRLRCSPSLPVAARVPAAPGHTEPLAVRLYGPPLRPAEASRAGRGAPSVGSSGRTARGSLRGAPRLRHAASPCSAVVRKCLVGAHRGGSLGGGGESGGRGPRGGRGKRWRRTEGVFFSFLSRAGVCKPRPECPRGPGALFSCPGALRQFWCLRGNSGGSGAGRPGRRRLYCGRAGARRERPGGRRRAGVGRGLATREGGGAKPSLGRKSRA